METVICKTKTKYTKERQSYVGFVEYQQSLKTYSPKQMWKCHDQLS